MRLNRAFLLLALAITSAAGASGLDSSRLGVLFNLRDPGSIEIARIYAAKHAIPAANLVGVDLVLDNAVAPGDFPLIRDKALRQLPSAVQSLVLVWSKPWAVGCMSITTAFAAGYDPRFCQPGCARTLPNPLFDSEGWLPADTVGWWPAMLLPTDDRALALALIKRGEDAPAGAAAGVAYLIRTQDASRNVRAEHFSEVSIQMSRRLPVRILSTPIRREVGDAIAYFTGVANVEELPLIRFRPGAVADHLTSTGGVLERGTQMSALAWLQQGATASYGSVSEPCNHLGKFPDPGVLLRHYTAGESALESYWKSVAMPGQGLFIGEPLARPFAIPVR